MKIEKNTKGRDFIVGDLHGCYNLLMIELIKVDFKINSDRMFSVGDLIDRGKQNLDCLDLLLKPWFFAVRGNHENMMLDSVRGPSIVHWYQNGGSWAAKVDDSILQEYCDHILTKMPYTIELETDKGMVGITHAEPVNNEWTDVFDPYTKQQIVWGRSWINKTRDMTVNNMYKTFHGHTPVEVVTQVGNSYFIDTGAVYNGNLTVMEIK